MKNKLKQIAILGKFSISMPIALTCLIGHVTFSQHISWMSAIVALGIFFMSAGASALNQLQEVKEDRQMRRTRPRPLASGKMSLKKGITIIALFLVTGSTILYQFNLATLLWGWMGVVWYNLIYTPLKRKTAFSVFPGAIVGAIPPVVGWVAAGGSILDYRIHFIAFFFFLGQMPHFWLLVLKYKDQYKKAGFPVITDILNSSQVNRINFMWFVATFISALFLPLFDITSTSTITLLITISTIGMIAWAFKHSANKELQLRKLFIFFNSFYLWIMLLILADQFQHF